MNLFLIIAGIVMFIVCGFFAIYAFADGGSGVATGLGLVAAVGIAVGIFGASFKIVPTGYTGVRTMFGQVQEEPVRQGFNWKRPFVEGITLVNNKQQDMRIEGEIWGETSERTPVYAADIVVTYRLSEAKSAWIYANITKNADELIDNDIISSAVKSAMVELDADSVTNRGNIEPLVRDKLASSTSEKYGEGTVEVLKVIINQMDFEQSYNDAIAAKSIAQQTYERQKTENMAAVEKAEADKQVALAKAEAEAEAARIKAAADAEVIKITAEAEAKANELIAASITDAILQQKFYERWDGKLPTVMGDSTLLTEIQPEI